MTETLLKELKIQNMASKCMTHILWSYLNNIAINYTRLWNEPMSKLIFCKDWSQFELLQILKHKMFYTCFINNK